jgi:hypothetical protein
MKNIKNFKSFLNENSQYAKLSSTANIYLNKNFTSYPNYDTEKIWKDANNKGFQALNDYEEKNPNDVYGGSVTLNSLIWIKSLPFPNPTSNLQVAGIESMGQSRLTQDRYKKKGEDKNVEWYGIPVLVSQGNIHQSVYANAVVDFLNNLGFEAFYEEGVID